MSKMFGTATTTWDGKRKQIYVGINGFMGVRDVFRFNGTPTPADTPLYKAVIGPFRTVRAANYMAANVYCADVATAERVSKSVA